MPIIKYTDKGFLREHPFGNPIDVPTPEQTHSYVFPGDEIVLYHKITLPDDSHAASMNNIKLVSAKVSLIAQKPNIFSEEFSREFMATRNFELDSFIVAFNNLNAMIIPWGADGYAPNLTVLQDRNWKLPSGDFRRQVNFFTIHSDGSQAWEYWFYFPILFRWEYWIALLSADTDFYNAAQAQSGMNHWWFHYFVDTIWTIKSRLDLNVLIDGVPAIIRSELNLTPADGDVNDYNSNADYTLKSIKTSTVGGSPTNNPAFIYGSENTVVIGYLSKVSAWDVGEEANISAVVWIEAFEGSGVTSRTRGSSLYPITPESVFMGLNLSATDDSGTGITDAAGNFVVYDPVGNGAMVLIDGLDIRIVGIIDYVKLKAAYPGITKFTVYARLYNSTLDADVTRKGEEIKIDGTFVALASVNVVCNQKTPDCPFNLDVYADLADADDLKNDKSDFLYFGDGTKQAITFTLQKNDNSCGDGDWEDMADITDNFYGRFFAFGKSPDFTGANFIDDYNKKYSGVFLEWRKVLTVHGPGKYRMKVTFTIVDVDSPFSIYDQRIFCLHAYNCNIINRTVRIETVNEGLRGTFGENELTDYAGGWSGQIRLKGLFNYNGSPYTKEYNQYGETSFNKFKPIINEQQPKFVLTILPIPGWMDFVINTNILQADEINITAYNTSNRHADKLVRVPVMNDGDYTPSDSGLINPSASVTINLAYGRNDLRRRNSQ